MNIHCHYCELSYELHYLEDGAGEPNMCPRCGSSDIEYNESEDSE